MSGATSTTEVRIGSILFTDLVGFTEFTDAVGDSAAVGVLDRQSELAGSVVGPRDDARIVKELGDGLMIWFDTAEAGLAAAIELLARIDEARSDGTFPLAVRMGLHHGEAVARGDDVVGHAVNVAARVSALAGPGELLISDEVVAACGTLDVSLQPVGPVAVRGVQDPVWLQRLSVQGPAALRSTHAK